MARTTTHENIVDNVWTVATVKYADGSIYKGHLTRNGERSSFGTLRYPILIYGAVYPNNMDKLINWMEYKGTWQDDEAHGYGTITRFRGDGTSSIIFQGEWCNGDRVEERESRDVHQDETESSDDDEEAHVERQRNETIGW